MYKITLWLEKWRAILFWGVDWLQGNPIKKHLKEIAYILENGEDSRAQNIQKKRLDDLLIHAIKTTPFYRHLKQKTPWHQFPIMNKNSIRDNFDSLQSKSFLKNKNYQVVTSGSTGTPLKIIQNKNKKLRNTADTLYFSEKVGYKLGHRLLYLRHWNPYYKKSALKNSLFNITPIEVLGLTPERINRLLRKLHSDPSNKSWLGFPSGFKQICNYLDSIKANPIQARLHAIIGMAEALNTSTKQRMEYYFKAPVFSRYSNMENGIMAQQTDTTKSNFEINWASFYIEILDSETDKPVKHGNKGRIVVTDLFNYAMPLIRYDTGDMGSIDPQTVPPTLKSVEGRASDLIYNTKGAIVSSFIMTNSVHYKGTKQMQLIQNSAKHYTLKYNGELTEVVKNNIIQDFKKFLGYDANIELLKVDEIPLLASGKQKVTINNFLNT